MQARTPIADYGRRLLPDPYRRAEAYPAIQARATRFSVIMRYCRIMPGSRVISKPAFGGAPLGLVD